jgi:hypothetical protein
MSTQTSQVIVSLSPDMAIVNYKGKTELFQVASPQYQQVKDILKNNKDSKIRNEKLVKFLEEFRADKKNPPVKKNVDYRATPEGVYIVGDDGEMLLPRVLGNRLLEFVAEGLPTEPIVKFCKRWSSNPSYISRERLFDCLEHNHHPLLPDGRFLAWKRVKQNSDGKLVDIRTGTFDNSVGQKPSMKRNQVDDDNDKDCSFGLHISSHSYALKDYMSGTGLMIEVAVDPADVVAVPKTYNHQKMRVCTYEVLNVCEEENKENLARNSGEFAVDPNDDPDHICDDCGEDLDYCTCDSDHNEYCLDCGSLWEDCDCDELDEEDE